MDDSAKQTIKELSFFILIVLILVYTLITI